MTTWQEFAAHKTLQPSELLQFRAQLRAEGKTLATLNGSFDLLHAGHLSMLFEASKQADLLLVALNSDRSIQQYKSPKRPIIPLQQRMEMIAALEFVSYVTWFEETDPCILLETLQPDVHVNGSEYGKKCIERETVEKHGGRIHIADLTPGLSTSSIVEKIGALCD
jgi:rfaE bifunctional protein nucleotidyltransferase chain/domain